MATMRTSQGTFDTQPHNNALFDLLLEELDRHRLELDLLSQAISSENGKHRQNVEHIKDLLLQDGCVSDDDMPMETFVPTPNILPKHHKKLTKQEKQQIRQRVRAESLLNDLNRTKL